MHPDELDGRLSPRQLAEWEEYSRVEPFGGELLKLIAARQTWASLQPHTRKHLDERDYLMRFEPRPPLSPAEYRAKSMRAYAGHGGYFSEN